MTPIRQLTTGITMVVALSATAAGCGLPVDDSATEIDDARIPERLRITTTTTTTTTPTPVNTAPPATTSPADIIDEPNPTSGPGAPPTTEPPTPSTSTTVQVVELVDVDVFFVPRGVAQEVERVTLRLIPPVVADDIIEQLERPPAEIRSNGLRSEVDPGLIDGYAINRGTATIDLESATFGGLSDSQKRRAIAQIVLSFTRFLPTDAGAIGQVVFTIDGTPIPIILPARGTTTSAGDPVAYDDFAGLIVEPTDAPPAASTVPPSTSPPAT